ncbi:hypothetical protein C8R44DRAFT_168883 [Mycena epipterygia]|nr:hypothetical protein C8R44DRAFT_168883 [Mycena epipterygia]
MTTSAPLPIRILTRAAATHVPPFFHFHPAITAGTTRARSRPRARSPCSLLVQRQARIHTQSYSYSDSGVCWKARRRGALATRAHVRLILGASCLVSWRETKRKPGYRVSGMRVEAKNDVSPVFSATASAGEELEIDTFQSPDTPGRVLEYLFAPTFVIPSSAPISGTSRTYCPGLTSTRCVKQADFSSLQKLVHHHHCQIRTYATFLPKAPAPSQAWRRS